MLTATVAETSPVSFGRADFVARLPQWRHVKLCNAAS